MRRIVIMAMSETGITCAKQIKKACPQDEVNILVSEAGLTSFTKSSHTDIQSAVMARQGVPFPDMKNLAALGLDVIATQQVQLDLGTKEIAVTTSKGNLTIRFNDLIIEVQANSRLPRPLHGKSNVFALPAEGFGQDSHQMTKVLAETQKNGLPALVVGSGMPAIDAIFLAREAGLRVLWLQTPSGTAPALDRHFTDYIVKQLQPHVVQFSVDVPAMEILDPIMDGDRVGQVTLPDGAVHTIGACIWAETFLTMHPILREDGFILDSSGKMTFTDEKPQDIHVIGSGVAQPAGSLCDGALTLPPYTGGREAALLSALRTATALSGKSAGGASFFGTASAVMKGMCVYRTGISEEEASRLQVPVEHATLCLSDTEFGGGAAMQEGRLSLNLIANKETKTIVGAQVIGEQSLAPLAHGTLGVVFGAMCNETSLDSLVLQESSGESACLVKKCADRLLDKLENAATGAIFGITPYEFMASLNAGADFFVLDIRSQADWRNGHIPLAHNIPVIELKKRLSSEVPRYVPIVVAGTDGTDAFHVAVSIASMGAKDLYVLDGGMKLWTYPLEKEV